MTASSDKEWNRRNSWFIKKVFSYVTQPHLHSSTNLPVTTEIKFNFDHKLSSQDSNNVAL